MSQTLIQLLERFGFPTFVCLWFMWRDHRREKHYLAMTTQLARLTVTCTSLTRTLVAPEDTKTLEEAGHGHNR